MLLPAVKEKEESPFNERIVKRKWLIFVVAMTLVGLFHNVLTADSKEKAPHLNDPGVMSVVAQQMSDKELRIKFEEEVKIAQEEAKQRAEEEAEKQHTEEESLLREQEAQERAKEEEEESRLKEEFLLREKEGNAKEEEETRLKAEEQAKEDEDLKISSLNSDVEGDEEESLNKEEIAIKEEEEEAQIVNEEAQEGTDEENNIPNDTLQDGEETSVVEEAKLEEEMIQANLEAFKTCKKRDVSEYGGSSKYKRLSTSTSVTGCLTFKCLENNMEKCDNNLSTNFDGPDPPCCTHILRDMARIFDETMCELGLDYIAAFGTVLGLVRAGRFIPWTEDNDYIILENDASALVDLWDAKKTGMGYLFQGIPRFCVTSDFAEGKLKKWEKKPLSSQLYAAGSPYIDIYVGKTASNGLFTEFRDCYHNPSDVLPSKRTLVYNGTLYQNLPADPLEAVRFYYGDNWNTPDKSKNKHGPASGWCVGSREVIWKHGHL